MVIKTTQKVLSETPIKYYLLFAGNDVSLSQVDALIMLFTGEGTSFMLCLKYNWATPMVTNCQCYSINIK